MDAMDNSRTTERYAWTVKDWGASVSISRASVYELIAAGAIDTTKFGGKRLITTDPRDWLASLKSEAA